MIARVPSDSPFTLGLSPQKRGRNKKMTYPEWLRQRLQSQSDPGLDPAKGQLVHILKRLKLSTVCQSARCPNLSRCWAQGTATFLVLGEICTRGCRFCNIRSGSPQPVDDDEPWRLLLAARELRLRDMVITSVTRDDLADGGAFHFSETIRVLRRGISGIGIEVLTPDFQGQLSAIGILAEAAPDIWGHNLETVPRLYPIIRAGANYDRSLKLLAQIKKFAAGSRTKSGLMLGLGETSEEVETVLHDLRQVGVDHLTLGQYLAPSRHHFPIARYIDPEEFDQWGQKAAEMGFTYIQSGPLVRSSYRF
jgi:lipoyl synthase